jgi:hypothetical protein
VTGVDEDVDVGVDVDLDGDGDGDVLGTFRHRRFRRRRSSGAQRVDIAPSGGRHGCMGVSAIVEPEVRAEHVAVAVAVNVAVNVDVDVNARCVCTPAVHEPSRLGRTACPADSDPIGRAPGSVAGAWREPLRVPTRVGA